MTTQVGCVRRPTRRRAKATKMSHARTTKLMARLSRRFIADSTNVPAGQETTDSSERTVPSPRPCPIPKGRWGMIASDSAMGDSCRALIEPELQGKKLHEQPQAPAFVGGSVKAEGVVSDDLAEDVERVGVGG